MRKRVAVIFLALLVLSGMPSIALGGNAFTLHPAGRGQQTHAQWKANVGETDAGGTGRQAIFMEKRSSQETQAVVVVRGLAGQPVTALQGLAWDRPTTGQEGSHCGFYPHWLITVEGTESPFTVANCFGQIHTNGQEPNWTRDTCTIANGCFPTTGFPSGATIQSLAIIFAPQNPDFVLLDNITVIQTTPAPAHTWTSAADNGNTAALQIGPSIAMADVVSDVLGDLLYLFPDVPATEWVLYPGVDLTPLPTAPTTPTAPKLP